MDTYHVSNALSEIWSIISRVNKYIDETTPWTLSKSENEEDKQKLNSVMFNLAESLRKIAIIIHPFMESTSKEILNQLNIDNSDMSWDTINTHKIKENTKVIEQGKPIFVRLDTEAEIEYIKGLMK